MLGGAGGSLPPLRPCRLLPARHVKQDGKTGASVGGIPVNPQKADIHKTCHPIVGTLNCPDNVAKDRALLAWLFPPPLENGKVVVLEMLESWKDSC